MFDCKTLTTAAATCLMTFRLLWVQNIPYGDFSGSDGGLSRISFKEDFQGLLRSSPTISRRFAQSSLPALSSVAAVGQRSRWRHHLHSTAFCSSSLLMSQDCRCALTTLTIEESGAFALEDFGSARRRHRLLTRVADRRGVFTVLTFLKLTGSRSPVLPRLADGFKSCSKRDLLASPGLAQADFWQRLRPELDIASLAVFEYWTLTGEASPKQAFVLGQPTARG